MDIKLQGKVVQILDEQSGEGKMVAGESETLFSRYRENIPKRCALHSGR